MAKTTQSKVHEKADFSEVSINVLQKFFASFVTGALAICIMVCQVRAQTDGPCASCGQGLEVACTGGHLTGGTSCYFDGQICYLNGSGQCERGGEMSIFNGCQLDSNLAVQLQIDLNTITGLADLNPHHALALAVIVGRKYDLHQGIYSKLRWFPVEVTPGMLRHYWLNSSDKKTKKDLDKAKGEPKKTFLNNALPFEMDVLLIGDNLTLTLRNTGQSLTISLKSENIIRPVNDLTRNRFF